MNRKRCGQCVYFGTMNLIVIGYSRCQKFLHPIHFNTNGCKKYKKKRGEK